MIKKNFNMLAAIIKTAIFLFLLSHAIFSQSIIKLNLNFEEEKLPFGLTFLKPHCYPKVGLALSGGGSRGLSQLGVLKAFEENNIPIEYIVGTSMGSIIGGLYSAGYSIKALDSIITSTDWNEFYTLDETDRNELFLDQKVTEDRALFAIRLDGFSPVIPTSFNTGQRVLNYLSLLTINAPLHAQNNFDELKYKFRAVCTDLVTGATVVLKNGSLSQAMRASSSVSFLLEPVELDSMLLVDGGLVANVPVEVTKQMGVDYVVAVNTSSSLKKRDELNDPFSIADQLVSIPISIITKENLGKADQVIKPKMKSWLNNDFSNIDSLIELGYQASLPHIKKIKESLLEISLKKSCDTEFFIRELKPFHEDSQIENQIVESFVDRDSVSDREIKIELFKLYNKGDYKNVSGELIVENNNAKLNVAAIENPEVKYIYLNGAGKIDEKKFNQILDSLIHKPYNPKRLLNALIEILIIYRSEGYSLADFTEIDFEERSNTLFINIDEGKVSKITIEGNSKTNTSVILREFPIEPGDYFSYEKAENGLENLRTTNLFKSIDINVIKKEEGNELKIVVKEKISSLIRFGLKIDNEWFTQFLIDIRDENLFGTGTELGALFFGGLRNQLLIAEYKANRIFATYLTYKLKGFYNSHDINTYGTDTTTNSTSFSKIKIGEYNQKIYGLSLGLGMQVEKFGNIIAEFRYEQDDIENIESVTVKPYTTDLAVLKFSLMIDSQDRYPYPTSGFFLDTYYETSQKRFGADISYIKYALNYKGYFPVSSISTLRPAIQIGFADETLPLSQQFSFGGQSSFMGYRQYDSRGRQIFIASLGYRFKLPIQIFFDTYIGARYDLGSIWENKEQIKFKNLRHGIGATISFDTPIGPSDFSVGRSFRIEKGVPQGKRSSAGKSSLGRCSLLFYNRILLLIKVNILKYLLL